MADFLLVLAGAGFAGYWLMRLRAWLAAQWFLVQLWRWHSGRTWNADVITDAGWFRPGTKAFTPSGHAIRWHYRPRWQRASIRTGATWGVIFLAWGYLEHRAVTVTAGTITAVLALGFAVRSAVIRITERRHRKTWLYPLHKRLASVVSVPLAQRAESWIEVAADRSRVRLALPAGFPADPRDKDRIVAITSASLALEAPEVSWRLAGPDPFVMLSKSQPPPSLVPLADVMEAVDAARSTEFVIGIGKKGVLIRKSLSGDAPHIGVSMGSGAGKSVMAAFLIMQWLHKGGIVLVLDAKWLSHTWLIGMPNVAYARTTEELHAAMCWLSGELDRRNKVALTSVIESGSVNGVVTANVGPRLLVVGEELNVAMGRLKTHWAEIRDPKSDPKTSPALTGFAELSYAGRQVKMHGLSIGQMLTARATGQQDSSVRESMGILALSRYTKRTWEMLAPQHPMPLSPTNPGRIQLVTARSVQEVQVPLIDLEKNPEPAREYALSGIVTPCPAGMPGRQLVTAVPALAGGADPAPDLRDDTPVTGAAPGGVSLREAVEAGLIGPTLAAVRVARHRDGDGFPEPVGYRSLTHLYDPAALASWQKARRS